MAVIALLAWGALSVWGQAPEKTVEWTVSATDTGNGIFEIMFSGRIADGWHTYSISDEVCRTEITLSESANLGRQGGLYEKEQPEDHDGNKVFYNNIVIAQKVKANAADVLRGEICWMSCTDQACA